jgi:hypothetical protein
MKMHQVGRLGTRQSHPHAQLDTAVEPAAERAAHPGLAHETAAKPERNRRARTTESRPAGALHAVDGSFRHDGDMNRSERIGFWIYVAMGSLCAAVLEAAAISAIVS